MFSSSTDPDLYNFCAPMSNKLEWELFWAILSICIPERQTSQIPSCLKSQHFRKEDSIIMTFSTNQELYAYLKNSVLRRTCDIGISL